MIRYKD